MQHFKKRFDTFAKSIISMLDIQAEFIGSFPKVEQCPDVNLPEYAFIGRSNVGKSSLVNMLTHRKKLAKTSSTPGKTQLINYFKIDESWHLVDLPGYGYAKISKKHRDSLRKMIENFVIKREQLVTIFVLIDSRIPPQKPDLEFIKYLGKHERPFSIVFTKVDKQSNTKTLAQIEAFKKELLKYYDALPPIFATSAINSLGRDQLLDYIENINHQLHYVDNKRN